MQEYAVVKEEPEAVHTVLKKYAATSVIKGRDGKDQVLINDYAIFFTSSKAATHASRELTKLKNEYRTLLNNIQSSLEQARKTIITDSQIMDASKAA